MKDVEKRIQSLQAEGEKRLKRYLKCKHRNVQSFTEVCLDCGENIYLTEREIRAQVERKVALAREPEWNEYNNW